MISGLLGVDLQGTIGRFVGFLGLAFAGQGLSQRIEQLRLGVEARGEPGGHFIDHFPGVPLGEPGDQLGQRLAPLDADHLVHRPHRLVLAIQALELHHLDPQHLHQQPAVGLLRMLFERPLFGRDQLDPIAQPLFRLAPHLDVGPQPERRRATAPLQVLGQRRGSLRPMGVVGLRILGNDQNRHLLGQLRRLLEPQQPAQPFDSRVVLQLQQAACILRSRVVSSSVS